MAMKGKSRPHTGGVGEENSSTRKRIQDVLGQARAQLRQSQQFRWTSSTLDTKNNNLSSRLTFQKQQQEDYWSTENAGEVIVEDISDPMRPPSKQLGKSKSFFTQDDNFGLPFRESMKRFPEAKPLGATRYQQKVESGKKGGNNDDASSDSTSISMNTTELKATSDDSDDDSDSSKDTVSSLRRAPSKTSRVSKEVRIIEPPRHQADEVQPSLSAIPTADVTKVPTTIKLTPLVANPINGLTVPEALPVEEHISVDDDDSDAESSQRPPSLPQHTTTVDVLSDDLGFTRASVKKAENDPHWFEKALMVRGEAISEAAYKAFKQAHEDQEVMKKSSTGLSVRMDPSKLRMLAPGLNTATPNNSNLPSIKEPEFTADWISDVDMSSFISDAEIPVSEFNDDNMSAPDLVSAIEDTQSTLPPGIDDELDLTIIEETNTESLMRTTTELEASGVLGEIAANLQNVLEISDKPESQDFSRMSAEERSFAREYDAAIQDKDEPLGVIFHSVYTGEMEDAKNAIRAAHAHQEEERKMTASTSIAEDSSLKGTIVSVGKSDKPTEVGKRGSYSGEEAEEEADEYDENTFLTTNTTTTNASKTKKNSMTIKSKLSDSKSTDVPSKMSSDKITTKSSSNKEKKSVVLQPKARSHVANATTTSTSKNVKPSASSPTPKPKGASSQSQVPPKVQSRSLNKDSKSRTLTDSVKDRRKSPSFSQKPFAPTSVLDPPTNRYQKKIQTILEKEVYEKELKRQRAERLREERKQERLERIAKESFERNKKTSWPAQPKMTEILLPELFKYKSVSGLQAAKGKKSEHFRSQPEMNYGAPYFRLDGALEGTDDGQQSAAQMLAQAQVETLDIPDLVREVLASNERMYRMTVETSRQMDRLYKDKLNARR